MNYIKLVGTHLDSKCHCIARLTSGAVAHRLRNTGCKMSVDGSTGLFTQITLNVRDIKEKKSRLSYLLHSVSTLNNSALKMEAVGFSETLVNSFNTTRYLNPEDKLLNSFHSYAMSLRNINLGVSL